MHCRRAGDGPPVVHLHGWPQATDVSELVRQLGFEQVNVVGRDPGVLPSPHLSTAGARGGSGQQLAMPALPQLTVMMRNTG